MFGLSIFEILFLAVLALIVIGPKELPEVARTIGRFLNELRRSTNSFTDEMRQQTRIDLNAPVTKPKPPAAPTDKPQPEQLELTDQSHKDENKKS
jgi:sec-independent protein translocase protein TatB